MIGKGMLTMLSVAVVMAGATTAEPETRTQPQDGADGKWTENFEKAKDSALATDRPILIQFTGSDWCPPCIRLKQTVFDHEDFKAFARDHLVLFMADFPRRKDQSDDLKAQNQALQRQYAIRGYPTLIIVDAKGTEWARTGFKPVDAKAYVEHLKGLIEAKPAL